MIRPYGHQGTYYIRVFTHRLPRFPPPLKGNCIFTLARPRQPTTPSQVGCTALLKEERKLRVRGSRPTRIWTYVYTCVCSCKRAKKKTKAPAAPHHTHFPIYTHQCTCVYAYVCVYGCTYTCSYICTYVLNTGHM